MPYRHIILDLETLRNQVIRVKKAELKILKTEIEAHQSIKKHHNTLRAFQDLKIIPNSPHLLNGHHIQHHLVDRSGSSHYRYALGLEFPHKQKQHHYIEIFGKGGGEAIHTTVEKKEILNKIEIISGICLFGSGRLKFDLGSNRKVSLTDRNLEIKTQIQNIFEDTRFSIYEIDGILGLSGFMNNLHFYNKNISQVHIEIPNIQYYLYLSQAYQDGYITSQLYQKYIEMVDRRADRIFAVLLGNLDIKSVNRMLSLKAIRDYLVGTVVAGKKLDLVKMQDLLSTDTIWKNILDLYTVKDWEDLMYLSYIVTVLKLGKKETGKTLIQVDDPIEQKILIKSAHFIKKLGKENYRIWGLYPVQKVFLNTDYTSESDLFYNEDLPMDETIMQRIFEIHGEEKIPSHFKI